MLPNSCVIGEEPIYHHVVKAVMTPLRLSEEAFLLKPKTLRHSPASPIIPRTVDLDAMEIEFTERMLYQPRSGPGYQAAAFKLLGDPVHQFGVF